MNNNSQSKKIFRKYYQPIGGIIEKPKHRVYTTTILSFLTVSLFAWYAIRPTLQTILSLRKEIKDNTQVNEQMETKITNLVEAQAIYQNLSTRIALLKEAIPPSPNIMPFIFELRTIANQYDITIISLNIEETRLKKNQIKHQSELTSSNKKQQSKDFETTPIFLAIEGTYENMKEIIGNIYSMERIANIAEMTAIPRKEGRVHVAMTIHIYSKEE